MTTITMTWEEFRKFCNPSRYPYCSHATKTYYKCGFKSNCPIWKRAERRETKEQWTCMKCGTVMQYAEKPVGRSGTPLVKDGKIVRLPKKPRSGK